MFKQYLFKQQFHIHIDYLNFSYLILHLYDGFIFVSELVLAEMRASFEKEKIRAVNDVRRASQVELEAAVKLAKSKQWLVGRLVIF